MSTREAQRAYTISEAADLKSVSPSTIRAAIKATEGHVLAAKNIGSEAQPRYRINASALEEWFAGLGDA